MKTPAGVANLLTEIESRAPIARSKRCHEIITRFFGETVKVQPNGNFFILTGDIPAMWIRDSTWQVRPLILASGEFETYQFISGVFKQQSAYLRIDPYANAFNASPTGDCWHKDFADQSPWVWERKFELDSIAAYLDLGVRLFEQSGRLSHFDETFDETFSLILDLIEREQDHDPESYIFLRNDVPTYDYLSHEGRGAPFARTGMVWSGFRPSDDACELPFHIPANFHLAVTLQKYLPIVFSQSERISQIVSEIKRGIDTFGWIGEKNSYAYEVDGLGNQVFGDDANIPSLLSLPYLGAIEVSAPKYLRTREFILSNKNPYFFASPEISGIGSRHTPTQHIWPIAIAMEGLTGGSAEKQLAILESNMGGANQMHESFNVNNSDEFTRPWFSWADMTYLQLVLKSCDLF
jgi:meiotically up-regulated gene 157 (Mug157) protein